MTARALGFALLGLLLPGEAVASPRARPAGVRDGTTRVRLALWEGTSLDLSWSAPPDCPDENTVKAAVLQLAGPRSRDPRHLKARGSIHAAAGVGFSLALETELDGVVGERTLTGVSCRSLSDAATLMLALILNPDAARATPPPAAVPLATTPSEPNLESQPLTLSWLFGAHAGVEVGVLQDASPSFALSLALALGHASLRFMPRLAPPQDITVSGQPGIGGRLWAGAAALLGCWTAERGRGVLLPCLGLEVTRLQGRGFGVTEAREGTIFWASAELALIAGLRLGRALTLQIGGVGLLPFSRPEAYLKDIGPISRPAVFAFRVHAGVEYALW